MEEIIRSTILAMQVCVPASRSEAEVIAFAEKQNPCGTSLGWQIAREGHRSLLGAKERVICQKDPNQVHYVLIA